MKLQDKIKAAANEWLMADSVRKLGNYKGYTVYAPVYKSLEAPALGLPMFILVKDERVYLSKPGFSILHHFYPGRGKNKSEDEIEDSLPPTEEFQSDKI